MTTLADIKIAIIGLGYVGLPLAVAFAPKYAVVGFDIDADRVSLLNQNLDVTKETNPEDLNLAIAQHGLLLTADLSAIHDSNLFIVTVPTPIDRFKKPNLGPLIKASEMLGGLLKPGDVVIYESTVYPGCTEEDCVPILEQVSGLIYNQDFFVGYSPERINPGDRVNTLTQIKKVTSGSTPAIAELVDQLYLSIISAGTHKAPSIKVAEASKAIENAQRDLNISFVNELSLIFDKMNIDTNDVIEAAATKWNFLKFKPGLVGGHCIGVDPYYLAYKAQTLGYHPEVILSGRKVNDNMGMFIANKVVKLLIGKGNSVKNSKALILGVTFKENCPDIRNSRVVDIYNELQQFGIVVEVYDPFADSQQVLKEYHIELLSDLTSNKYDSIILAVAHRQFLDIDFKKLTNGSQSVIFDTKAFLDRQIIDARL